jgi:hypothetical protein
MTFFEYFSHNLLRLMQSFCHLFSRSARRVLWLSKPSDYQFSHPYFSGHVIFRSKLSKKHLTIFYSSGGLIKGGQKILYL